MNLIELEFQLRSFEKRQTISFPQNGMVMIIGKRLGEDTGSGAGKSSIPIAIAFALGFCDLPMTDLANWHTDEKPYVRLRLSSKDGNIYDIIRDPKLSVLVNGVPNTGTATAADELLKGIIKTTPELTKTLTYSPQRSSDKFITKTDSEQKEFLTSVLDLAKLEKAEEQLLVKLKSIQNMHQTAIGTIKQIESLEPTFRNISQEELQSAYDELTRLNLLRQSSVQPEISQKLRQEIQMFDAEINKINQIKQAAANAVYQNTQIKTTVENIKSQIEVLKQNRCPTCQQEWNAAETKIVQLESQKQSLAQTYKSNMAAIESAKPYNDSVISNLASLKTAAQQQLIALQQPQQEAERNFQLANQNYANLTNQVTQQKTLFERKSKAIADESQYAIQEYILYHASQIAGRQGFLGDIFQEVLAEIETATNDWMSCATNVNTFTLQFSTESVTKAGKVNKKIATNLIKGNKVVKLKSLSGGQQASIELAVELAVISVVKRRSGIDYGWLILDESMDGMDVPLKYEWIEAIKTRIDSLLIVIDHSSEIKELFDSVIEVTFDGQNSEISVA